jgi:hypothetical protein
LLQKKKADSDLSQEMASGLIKSSLCSAPSSKHRDGNEKEARPPRMKYDIFLKLSS